MSDSNTKPVEVVEPLTTEVPEENSNGSEAKVEVETTTEPVMGENGAGGSAAEGDAAKNDAVEGNAAEGDAVKVDAAEGDVAEGTPTDNDKPSIFRPPPGMLRVTGPREPKKFVKSDPTSLEETDDPREIRKQVSHVYTKLFKLYQLFANPLFPGRVLFW